MLSLWLEMTADYLIPTDLIAHFCGGKKGRKEGDWTGACSRSLRGRGLAPDWSVYIHPKAHTHV